VLGKFEDAELELVDPAAAAGATSAAAATKITCSRLTDAQIQPLMADKITGVAATPAGTNGEGQTCNWATAGSSSSMSITVLSGSDATPASAIRTLQGRPHRNRAADQSPDDGKVGPVQMGEPQGPCRRGTIPASFVTRPPLLRQWLDDHGQRNRPGSGDRQQSPGYRAVATRKVGVDVELNVQGVLEAAFGLLGYHPA
jgi:hypothetical protein